jgi:hypothetical protein
MMADKEKTVSKDDEFDLRLNQLLSRAETDHFFGGPGAKVEMVQLKGELKSDVSQLEVKMIEEFRKSDTKMSEGFRALEKLIAENTIALNDKISQGFRASDAKSIKYALTLAGLTVTFTVALIKYLP